MNTATQPKIIDSLKRLGYLEHLLKLERNEIYKLSETAGRFYKPFDIHKKGTDKWRHIDNPQYPLKSVQTRILKKILNRNLHLLPEGMNGGISGRSIVDNAQAHIGKECIGIVDIKECFPSTNHHQVNRVWVKYFGCGYKTANILTKLTTLQHRLPQGAPTSPLLCNLVLAQTFKEIKSITDDLSLNVSIFIDDITVSGSRGNVTNSIAPIVEILIKHGYAVRRRKVKIIPSSQSQKVTGIPVNKKLSIGRKHVQQIRNLILETAALKGYISSGDYHKIHGKISFAKSVSRAQGDNLEKFAEMMLVHPLVQEKVEKDENRRDCKRFSGNHKYTGENYNLFSAIAITS